MAKYDNQLRLARDIINHYDGKIPLAAWLKQYFREHKQAGSKDRKILSAIVYAYFRLGKTSFNTVDERLNAAISISPELTSLKEYFHLQDQALPEATAIFPWTEELSTDIEPQSFACSFLVQPDLFIRIRPGMKKVVEKKLTEAGLPYQQCNEDCFQLSSASRITELLDINREVVIQDKNSQKTGSLLLDAQSMLKTPLLKVWDCCAASGGKSIMAIDLLENVELTVSDKRESILHNLDSRFQQAGITKYRSLVADLADEKMKVPEMEFDLVIADVPCSGSGTWSRTPEQLSYFSLEKLGYYQTLQQSILRKIIPALKPGGMLVYITCSVFKKENEDALTYMESLGMRVMKSQLFAGYNDKADTLFAALLTNSSV